MIEKRRKKVLLAVPDDDFVYTETVGGARELEHCATLTSKDEVLPAAKHCNPDVVVLSPDLEGETDLLDVVEGLVENRIRIVFLAGSLVSDNPTVERISKMGVGDILYGTPTAGVLLEHILSPGEPAVMPGSVELSPDDEETERQSVRSVLKTAGETLRQVRRTRRVAGKQVSGIYAVWSPVSAGRTFVSVNLATIFALQGLEVTLIDAAPDLSCCYWTGAPDGEEGLFEAIQDPNSAFDVAFRPSLVPGLSVLTADPNGEKQTKITPKQIETLAKSVRAGGQVVVLDLPAAYDASMLALAETVVFVADLDIARLYRIQKTLDELEEEGTLDFDRMVLVLNRFVESKWLPEKSAQDATCLNVAALIPEATKEVLECARTGNPAVMVNPELQAAFSDIAEKMVLPMT